MTWFKVDDGIHSHPKFLDVSLAAVGLWTMCGAWCSGYLTDGQITRRQVLRLGGDDALAAILTQTREALGLADLRVVRVVRAARSTTSETSTAFAM